jgi:guanylate kinase
MNVVGVARAPFVKVVVFVGVSGSGKSTLIEQCGFMYLRGTTTRPPRSDDTTYDYVGADEFQRAVDGGDYRNHTVRYGNHYGISNANFDLVRQCRRDEPPFACCMDLSGALVVRDEFAHGEVAMVYVACATDTARERLLRRQPVDSARVELRMHEDALLRGTEHVAFLQQCSPLVISNGKDAALEANAATIRSLMGRD